MTCGKNNLVIYTLLSPYERRGCCECDPTQRRTYNAGIKKTREAMVSICSCNSETFASELREQSKNIVFIQNFRCREIYMFNTRKLSVYNSEASA